MTDFAWLIESPGPNYLGVHELGHFPKFYWTPDANKALRFWSKEQADLTAMTIRRMEPKLWGFAVTLGEAWPREHGWFSDADVEQARGLQREHLPRSVAPALEKVLGVTSPAENSPSGATAKPSIPLTVQAEPLPSSPRDPSVLVDALKEARVSLAALGDYSKPADEDLAQCTVGVIDRALSTWESR